MQEGTVHGGPSLIFLSRDLPRFLEGETGGRGRGMVWVRLGLGDVGRGFKPVHQFTDQVVRDSNVSSLFHKYMCTLQIHQAN